MIISPIKTRVFKENESIVDFIIEHLPELKDDSVLVITSKIVGLAEGRTAAIEDKKKVIEEESDIVIPTKWVTLTLSRGRWCASAGIDESNADGKIILLPQDSFKSAKEIRLELMKHYKIENLGVIITDSKTIPFRYGVIGGTLGYAGLKAFRDYRKTDDIFGRPYKMAQTNVIDSLSIAAVCDMGEGNEQQPLALISDARVEFTNEEADPRELHVDAKDDVYAPLYTNLDDLSSE